MFFLGKTVTSICFIIQNFFMTVFVEVAWDPALPSAVPPTRVCQRSAVSSGCRQSRGIIERHAQRTPQTSVWQGEVCLEQQVTPWVSAEANSVNPGTHTQNLPLPDSCYTVMRKLRLNWPVYLFLVGGLREHPSSEQKCLWLLQGLNKMTALSTWRPVRCEAARIGISSRSTSATL